MKPSERIEEIYISFFKDYPDGSTIPCMGPDTRAILEYLDEEYEQKETE